MKKLLIIFCPLFFYAQQPSVQDFFEEYRCNCESYDNESLFEFFGCDVEDDVTPAIEAINSFCKNDQKVIKVPNTNVFKIVAPLLLSKGISRIVRDKTLIAL